jgi:hypothetical protein
LLLNDLLADKSGLGKNCRLTEYFAGRGEKFSR